MTKIILLNGPPRCGKDFAGEILFRHYEYFPQKFAAELKYRTHCVYEIPHLEADYFEDCKEDPCHEFLGLTPRQAYIAVSEQYFKPVHGTDIFGKFLLETLQHYPSVDNHVITDSGFVEEAQVLIDHYGADAVTLVRIHREGCNFSNDSRSYLELPGVRTIDIVNDGTESFEELLIETL